MRVKNKLNVFIVTTWRDQSLLQNLLRSLDWAKDTINEIVIISEVKIDLSLSKKIKVRVLLKKTSKILYLIRGALVTHHMKNRLFINYSLIFSFKMRMIF